MADSAAKNLPEYKQGEDASLQHVDHPSMIQKFEVSAQGAKQNVENMTYAALDKMKSMISEDTRDNISSRLTEIEKFANSTMESILNYISTSRVGVKFSETEKWMETEANWAQHKLVDTVKSYYNQYNIPMSEEMKKQLTEVEKKQVESSQTDSQERIVS